MNLQKNDGKRKFLRMKGSAYDQEHSTLSFKHVGGSVVAWTSLAATGTGSLAFIDNVGLLMEVSERKRLQDNTLCLLTAKCCNADRVKRCRWTRKTDCKSNTRSSQDKNCFVSGQVSNRCQPKQQLHSY